MKIKFSKNAKTAAQIGLLALLVVFGSGLAARASALGAGDADTVFNGYNNAFLVNGSYYQTYSSNTKSMVFDGGWTGALDIMVAEDAYERTGSSAHKALVNTLCTTFLQKFPPGYTWDGYNDDEGWIGAMLARGYLITGNANLLSQARTACFDMVWSRGWDTQYNGGGIWEQQPNMTPAGEAINKTPLSNDSLGKTACLIYMGNHNQWYLDRATQIYDWVWHNLYNPNTGQVYSWIDRSGNVDRNTADATAYNQGTFADYANYLYQITGNVNYYNDAQKALDYVKNTMYNGGVITGGGTNTWSDEYARGLGHFCRDNRQWGTYYNWMVLNANAIMSHRRTDYNLCWGNFSQQTPTDNTITTNRYDDAAAWMQYTPATMPNNIWGRHTIVGLNNMAIDTLGLTTASTSSIVELWGLNYGQTQVWNFTQNADTSWNIVSQSSWLSLDDPGGSATNGTKMIQWTQSRDSNQRWWVDQQSDGSYKIWNQQSGLALDSSSTTTNGQSLIEWGWSGQPQQRWLLQ